MYQWVQLGLVQNRSGGRHDPRIGDILVGMILDSEGVQECSTQGGSHDCTDCGYQ